MIKKDKIFIATGGTGGHVFPAYSLASFLEKKNYSVKLTIDNRGYNYLKNFKNLDFKKIPSTPLIKKNILSFTVSIFIILYSILKSLFFLIFNRPSIIIGMGGYSSFPVCVAAIILRIKFVIYENNLIIGKANKYLLPFAKKIFVSYKQLEAIPQKYQNKVIEIGNIIREEIINLKIKNTKYEFKDIKILVLGGSQAAKIFANVLPEIFKKLKNSGISIQVYQQCQRAQNIYLSNFYKEANINNEIFNFTSDIVEYYSKANLVITRSGASVLGELINVQIPFISIPLPSSADGHQLKNAIFYKEKGLGFFIEENEVSNKLFNLIKFIYNDNSQLKSILSKQSQYSDKNIFQNINSHIEKIIYEKN